MFVDSHVNHKYILQKEKALQKRGKNEQNLYLIAKLQTDIEKIGETEYEISKEKRRKS